MRNRGFTLVELLAVVAILAMLELIIVPVINNVLNDNKAKLYNLQIQNIEDGARGYVSDRVFSIDISVGSSKGITLGTLKQQGYVENDIVNPLTKERFSDNMVIIISNTSTGFTFKVCTSDIICETVDML